VLLLSSCLLCSLQFSNGWCEGITHLHYILLVSWENYIRKAWNSHTNFQWKCKGENTCFWIVISDLGETLVEGCESSDVSSHQFYRQNFLQFFKILSEDQWNTISQALYILEIMLVWVYSLTADSNLYFSVLWILLLSVTNVLY
jgi:hypothetical protein